MSNLSDFFAKAATAKPPQSGSTPHSQLAFTTIGGFSTQGHFDSFGHDSKLVSRQYVSFSAGDPKSNRMIGFTPMNYSGQPGNSAGMSSQGGHGITMNGWLGHNLFDFQLDQTGGQAGSMGPFQENYLLTLLTSHACGTVIGQDQDYALIACFTGAAFNATQAHLSIVPRGMKLAMQSSAIGSYASHQNAAQNKCHLHTAGALSSGYAMMIGGISHNQSTGNMVIIERTGAAGSTTTAWRPVLLKNVPDPRKYVNRDKDYEAALTTAMATASNRVTGGDTTAGNTTRGSTLLGSQLGKVILCDDNTVVMYLKTDYANQVHRWKWNGSSFNAPEFRDMSNEGTFNTGVTPSVGWQMTLDGKESVFYSAMLYYGCGLRAYFVDNTNGNMSHGIKSNSTSTSFAIAPMGASRFQMFTSENSDSYGFKGWLTNKSITDRYIGNHDPAQADYFSSAVVLNVNGHGMGNLYDSSNNSTNYPTMAVNIRVDNKAIVAAETGE